MSISVPKAIRDFVFRRANRYCEYCLSSELITGQTFHCEHIIPRRLGGTNTPDNLCCSCPRCNGSKGQAVSAFDSISNQTVPLFNPRKDDWQMHFVWVQNGLRVEGITPVGRATVEKLKMNAPLALSSRRGWIQNGTHPPGES